MGGLLSAQSKSNDVKSNALVENFRMTIDDHYRGGLIEKKTLESALGIIPFDMEKDSLPIKSYEIDIICKSSIYHIKNNGVLIIDSVKKLFHQLKPLDKVKFYNWTFTNGFVLKQDTLDFTIDVPRVNFILDQLKWYLSSNTKDNLAYLSYFDPLGKTPISHTSNCNCFDDSCSVFGFSEVNMERKIVYILRYKGLDSIQVQIFKEKTLLADIGYNGELLNGEFTVFYANGKKRIEGEFVKYKLNNEDTITLIHPQTLTEFQQIRPIWSSNKTGVWKFYNQNGALLPPKKTKEKSFYKLHLENKNL